LAASARNLLHLCRLQDIPGASVEHNNFCVSAHFRNCATENWQKVVVAVNDSVAAQQAQLHVTRGRKVLEVRPQVRLHSFFMMLG
jgi:trehalose 6-phosphate phosphatase